MDLQKRGVMNDRIQNGIFWVGIALAFVFCVISLVTQSLWPQWIALGAGATVFGWEVAAAVAA
jgi:hypothetical protein